MAAPAKSVTPDTEITIKVAIDGNHRRFRLPLKELTASTLPNKVCFDFLLRDPLVSDCSVWMFGNDFLDFALDRVGL